MAEARTADLSLAVTTEATLAAVTTEVATAKIPI
jgi:hypothetical protein